MPLARSLLSRVALILTASFAHLAALGGEAAPTVRFDFESGGLQGWEVVEGRFDYLVSDRPTYHNFPTVPYNKQGRYYLSTVEQQPGRPSNDGMTGVVESPVFVLAGPAMSFLVGGGDFPTAYVALCTLDGREVRKAQGKRTEEMQRTTWAAPELVGKPVFLRVVDRATHGWGHVTLDDFQAAGTLDPDATKRRFAAIWQRRLDAARQEFAASFEPLRAAVTDLRRTFGDRYLRGREFLAKLDGLQARVSAAKPDEISALRSDLDALRREALLANPLVAEHPILFEVRPQHVAIYHAIDTLYQVGEATDGKYHRGGALKLLDAPTGRVRTLIETAQGTARSPCVSFDGQRVLFCMRRHPKENLHIFEVRADGTGLRQLTFAPDVTDFDPLYLPDGGIVFSSTREPKYNMCSQDLGANLFRMDADGANIHQITKNTLFDNQAALLPDGRILYSRWEYVDRNFGDAHGLWTVHPDGTNQSILWGNNTASPAAVYYGQPIPGSHRLLCILSTHHHSMWGPLAIIDPTIATDGKAAIVRTWPAEAMNWLRDGDAFDCDGLNPLRPKYETPWPLSDRHFLCSRMTGQGDQMGLYLIDLFGNEVLLHAEGPGCFSPMPLAPRPRPPALPSRRSFESAPGTLYVLDVYQGTHMQGVPRGMVKRLRVVESPEKRAWTPGKWYGQGFQAPGMNWHDFTAKRILGTVPVEADGSAYLTVPPDRFLYFQLLDADGLMIQTMRSGTVVQPGETTGCVGCHESRLGTPPSTNPPAEPALRPPKGCEAAGGSAPLPAGTAARMAFRRAPSALDGWHGPPRPFSYAAEVQPVLDKHCLRCHDFGQKGAEKLLLAGDKDPFFNASYTQLWRKGLLKAIGAGPASIQPALSWGARASRIVQVLQKGHNDVRLDPESFDRLVTWIDLNAPYYPTYDSAYPDHLAGRCPLDNPQLTRLGQLTGVDFFNRECFFDKSTGPHVSFDRPELSPCLARLDKAGPQYREALALIQAGKAMLAQRPRADMPGFQPCEKDRQREAFYEQRLQIERRNREAIRRGERVYDQRAALSAAATP